jgi:hypothetical protein
MAKIRISKTELRQIIKEEYSKKMTEIKLKNRLRQINEEIEDIMSDDENLEEVEAGSPAKVRSTGWTGEKNGDTKWDAKFQKKGSHLVEEDNVEDEESIIEDVPEGDEMEDDLDIDQILSQLAGAIENKIEDTVEEKMGNSEDVVSDELDNDEIEIDVDMDKVEDESGDETDKESMDDEPIEEQNGESVAQDQKPKNAVPFNNGAAKIPNNDERDKGSIVSESTKKRMQVLSGIKRNDFND